MKTLPLSVANASGGNFADAFQGSAVVTKVLAHNEHPQRQILMDQIRNQAMAQGATAHQATMYAKHQTSSWNAMLRPTRNSGNPMLDVRNALLSENDWRLLTDEVVQVARAKRVIVDDLVSRGLTMPLPDIGTFSVEWQRMTDLDPADVSMSMSGNRQTDRADFNTDSAPVPIIHKDFYFDVREILAARQGGILQLDQTHVAMATTLVSEAEETIIMNGASNISWNGTPLYGLTTHPNRLTLTGSDFGTVANIETTFRSMVNTLLLNNHNGPFGVYVATTQYSEMKQPRSATSDTTMLEFVQSQHPEIAFIKRAPMLADGVMLGVELDRGTIDLAIAQDVTVVQWDAPGGDGTFFRVFSSMTPRLKTDRAATPQTGFIHVTSI